MDTSAIDNFINKYKEEINELKTKISSVEDPEKEFNFLQKIAESYYILSEQYKLRRNLTKLLNDYNEMMDAKRQSFISIEKSLFILRKNSIDVLNNAHWFIRNIGFEYDYLITHSGEVPSEIDLYYSSFSPYPNRVLNILVNNISEYQRIIGIFINEAKRKADYDNIFIYSEVMGDLFLFKQLLIEDLIDVNIVRYLDNAHFSYYYYDKALQNRYKVDEREVAKFGLVDTEGHNYQNVMYLILEKRGFPFFVRSMLEEKIKFMNNLYPFTINRIYFPPFRSNTHDKLYSLLKDTKIPNYDEHDKIFIKLCEWLCNMLNMAYDNKKYFRQPAQDWNAEEQMHTWMERELKIFEVYTNHKYNREAESGGGKCEHWIDTIPLDDKLVSDYEGVENIQDFISSVYEKYGDQVIQYAEGKKSKYSFLIVADVRDEIKNHLIRRSPCHKCIDIKYDSEYKIWIWFFVFQALYKPPSKLNLLKTKK